MNDRFEARRAAFRGLHDAGFFVLPNPWDRGSAVALQSLGFAALATTSSGAAFAQASADGAMALDEVLAHTKLIVEATDLPVNADFEDGHAESLDALAANVRACVDTGVAAVSIEDSTGDAARPLYELDVAVRRLRAARAAIDAMPGSASQTLLVGRAECYLTGHASPLDEALRRLQAYAEAGADVLYAPGPASLDDIARIVRAVAPKPVNVLLRPGDFPSLDALAGAGVRRASTGGALAVAAWSGFLAASKRLAAGDGLVAPPGASHAALNELFSG